MTEHSFSGRAPAQAREAVTLLLVCAAYYVGGLFGIALRFPDSGVAIIWPPNSILLAALLLSPPTRWWLYLAAVVPTHLHLVSQFQVGVPLLTSLSQVSSNIVQALLAAMTVRYACGAPPRFDNLRSMGVFTLLAAIVAPAGAAALAAYLFVITGWTLHDWSTLRLRFLANVVATLTLTPLIVLAVSGGVARLRAISLRRYTEFGLLVLSLFAVGIPVFGWEAPGSGGGFPALLYAPLPLLLWAAVRFGMSGLCLSLLVVALLSLSNAVSGRGPFASRAPAENVLSLQVFLIAISLPLAFLAALIEERRRRAESLRQSHNRYRLGTDSGGVGVWDWELETGEIYVDPLLKAMLGYQDHEIRNHLDDWGRLVHPEDAGRVMERARAHLAGEVPHYEVEYRMIHKDGSLRWVLARGAVVRDHNGRALRIVGTDVNITDRKRAEELLRNIAEGVSAVTGETFFRSLVKYLSQALEADYAYVCQAVGPKRDVVRTMAACADGKIVANFDYRLAGTPCEKVMAGHLVTYPDNVQTLFPDDNVLQEMGATSYLGMPLRIGTGHPVGLINVINRKPMRDVQAAEAMLQIFAARATAELERVRAEAALRQGEERYRNVVETQTELICRNLPDTTLTFVNDAYCRYFGRTREQLLGTKFLDLIPESARAKVLTNIEALCNGPGNGIGEQEHQVLNADGSIGWQHWVNRVILDSAGRTELQGIGRDVTERKRLEEDLRRREREFSTLVENSPDVISRLDREFRFIYISRAVERVLGIPSQDFIGKSTSEVGAPGYDWAGLEASCLQAFQSETTVEREFTYDGRCYHTRMVPEYGPSGSVESVLCISQDTTERKEAETELQRLSGRLLDLQDEERRRIARELHDVTAQNLFAIAINLAQLQQPDRWLSAELKNTLAECQSLCEQSLQEIRTLSYLLHPPMLDQAGLVAALQWYIDGFSKRSGIDVGLVVTQEIGRLPRNIETDLFRIVQEGLANIHRHSGSGTATVRLERTHDQMILQIKDQGCGMPATVALAEPQGVRSLGVGVPGMRQRLLQLGGRLEIESGAEGTMVSAFVPLVAETAVRTATARG